MKISLEGSWGKKIHRLDEVPNKLEQIHYESLEISNISSIAVMHNNCLIEHRPTQEMKTLAINFFFPWSTPFTFHIFNLDLF